MNDDNMLTPKQAAEHTGMTIAALAQLRHRGKGPTYFRQGRSIFYDVKILDSYLSKRTQLVEVTPSKQD